MSILLTKTYKSKSKVRSYHCAYLFTSLKYCDYLNNDTICTYLSYHYYTNNIYKILTINLILLCVWISVILIFCHGPLSLQLQTDKKLCTMFVDHFNGKKNHNVPLRLSKVAEKCTSSLPQSFLIPILLVSCRIYR